MALVYPEPSYLLTFTFFVLFLLLIKKFLTILKNRCTVYMAIFLSKV